jgi:hypothetical protein
MRRWILSVALVGCSFPTKPGPPFGCIGDTLPTRAPATIQIRGQVFDPFGNAPVSGAIETGFVIGPTPLKTFSVTTDDAGVFMASEMTGGAPHAQFLQSHVAGYLDTFAYPALPVAGDVDVSLLQLDQAQLGEIACGGCPDPDLAKAYMIVSVVNCNGDAVAGATVAVTPASAGMNVIYFAHGLPDPSARVTDETTGAAFVSGLSPGSVTVKATFGTTPYHDHDVTALAGTLTLTEVSP